MVLSVAMQNKLERLNALADEINALREKENEIDDNLLLSKKEKREELEEVYHQQRKFEGKVEHLWESLSGKQQLELWELMTESRRWVLDGI